MKVFVVLECRTVEHAESFGVMSVHSSEEKAKEAVTKYESVAKDWARGHADYYMDEFELDSSYYGCSEVR